MSHDRTTDEKEIKSSLRAGNRNFRKLDDLHKHYEQELEFLNKCHCLTQDQETKKTELKKLKLQIKDRMAEIIREYHTHGAQVTTLRNEERHEK